MYALTITERCATPSRAPAALPAALPALPARLRHAALHRPAVRAAAFQQAGPQSPEPSYAAIEAQPLNRLVMQLFRNKMVAAIGEDSKLQG
jgi:hypothetical protein